MTARPLSLISDVALQAQIASTVDAAVEAEERFEVTHDAADCLEGAQRWAAVYELVIEQAGRGRAT